MEINIILSVLVGLGLSIAAGLRVFIPLLIAGVAIRMGWLDSLPILQQEATDLTVAHSWLATTPALIGLSVAMVTEVLAAKIVLVDHFLDLIAAPLAVAAGFLLTSTFMGPDVDPFFKYSFALIAGGGSAAITHTASSLMRLFTLKSTAGVANPVYAVTESTAAVGASLLSIFLPISVFFFFIMVLGFFIFRKKKPANP